MKLKQEALSISQHRRGAWGRGSQPGGRNHTEKDSSRPTPETWALLPDTSWRVAFRCPSSSVSGHGIMFVEPDFPSSAGARPLTSPRASASTSLWPVCLWFPGRRVGRKGPFPQDTRANWSTREVMLGCEGGGAWSWGAGAGRKGSTGAEEGRAAGFLEDWDRPESS